MRKPWPGICADSHGSFFFRYRRAGAGIVVGCQSYEVDRLLFLLRGGNGEAAPHGPILWLALLSVPAEQSCSLKDPRNTVPLSCLETKQVLPSPESRSVLLLPGRRPSPPRR